MRIAKYLLLFINYVNLNPQKYGLVIAKIVMFGMRGGRF